MQRSAVSNNEQWKEICGGDSISVATVGGISLEASLSEHTKGALLGALVVLVGVVLYRMIQRFRFVPSRTGRCSPPSLDMQSVAVRDYGSIQAAGRCCGKKMEVGREAGEYRRGWYFGV